MTITNQHLLIYRGDSETVDVDLTAADGSPFTLADGGTIKYRISDNAGAADADALVRKELNAGITIDESTAVVNLTVDDTNLPPGIYYHELKVIEGVDVATAMTGNLIVRASLTMVQVEQASAEIDIAADISGEASQP